LLLSSQFSGIVGSTVSTLASDKVIGDLSGLFTILTVNAAGGVHVGSWHGLHPHGRIEHPKVLTHIFDALLTEGTSVGLTTHVHAKTGQVHDMSAFESPKRFGRLEHAFVTNGTRVLQLLRNAVMIIIGKTNAGIAMHTMTIINAQSLARSTDIAKGTMINVLFGIIVEIANATKVTGKARILGFATLIDTGLAGWLETGTFHAQDLRYGISIERRIRFLEGILSFLFTAQTACV